MRRKPGFAVHSAIKNTAGAATVEYAIVFPVVIICILILVYLGMLYYQQCLMQAAVSGYVQNLAFLWGYEPDVTDPREGVTSRNAYVSEGMYWHIYTDVRKRGGKAVRDLQDELMSKSIIKPEDNFEIEVNYRNLLLSKKVGIRAKAAYPLPFKGFFNRIDLSGYCLIEAYSETTVNDPQDFMQNVDYLLQIYEESGAKEWVEERCKPLVNALQDIKGYFK